MKKEKIYECLNHFNLCLLNEKDIEIITSTNTFSVIDKDGYKYLTSIKSLQNNIRRKCSGLDMFSLKNPYSLENIKIWIKNNNIDIELVSEKYLGIKEHLLWKCKKCGEIFSRSFGNVKSKNSYYCRECALRIGGDVNRHDEEEVYAKIESLGYIILERNYKNATSYIHIKDNEGYKYRTTYDNLINAKSTPNKFRKENPYTIENIKNYIKINKLNVELLSTTYKNCDEKLVFRCGCGDIFYCSWDKFLQGQTRCEKCSKKQSSISLMTQKWLEENGISFIKEKSFKGFNTEFGKPYRYDYYIESTNILIEVDGRQHFEYSEHGVYTKERVEETQRRDRIKDNFAKENGFKIIRLHYKSFRNDEYIKILNKEFFG